MVGASSTRSIASAEPYGAGPPDGTASPDRANARARGTGRTRPDLLGLLLPVTVLALWEASSRAGLTNPVFLPPPTKVFARALDYFVYTNTGWTDILGSSYRVMFGFAIASVIGIALGLVVGLWTRADAAISPTINVLKNIAPIAWTPLAILWFGLGDKPALFLLFIGGFFPIVLNTVSGVRGIDRIYLRVAQNVGASGPFLFWNVMLPGAMPSIITGLRVTLGISWMIVIVAEMLAVPNGLGYRLTQAREYAWTDLVLVTMFTVGLCGFLFDQVAVRLGQIVLRWHPGIGEGI